MNEGSIAKIAVSGVTYWFDRPYSYAVPAQLVGRVCPGIRVVVPFGGSRLREGMVLAMDAQADRELKTIRSVLDEEPLLTERQIRLALWMRERFFCTVMVISAAIPIADPYLADRIAVRCEKNGCGVIIVINKCDLDPGDSLFAIYRTTGYPTVRTSTVTGFGIEELRQVISGRVCCFTGNSGVGKSSILNALDGSFSVRTGEVSQRLGRGRHTTRHGVR